jgi:hypothetical protein
VPLVYIGLPKGYATTPAARAGILRAYLNRWEAEGKGPLLDALWAALIMEDGA